MDIREKLKAKRRKKKSLAILTSIALVTTTLATLKLADISMPLEINSLYTTKGPNSTKNALSQNNIEEERTSEGINLKITGVADNGVQTIQVYQGSTKVADYTYSDNATEKQEDVKVSIPFGETENIIVKLNGNVVEQKQVTNMRYISTAQDLCNFRDIVNAGNTFAGKYVELTNDIDLSSVCSSTLGSWTPIGNYGTNKKNLFSGAFNGNGYTISNIYINSDKSFQGLFGYNEGVIRNFNVSGDISTTSNIVAILVGYNTGSISNINVLGGTAKGSQLLGGVVGNNAGGIVICCVNNATITYNRVNSTWTGFQVGGITGLSNGIIKDCINNGNVTACGYIGGIVGDQYDGKIMNCVNTRNINR